MNVRPSLLLFAIFILFSLSLQAQNTILYSNYFLNPSLYNPAYTGANGYTELFLNFRRQWSSFEGAPTTATLNAHLPLSYKTSIGLTAFQDQAGIVRTTSGMATFAYQVHLGTNIEQVHKLAFGISAGMTNSFLKDPDNPDDPAIANNTTSFLNGQFGLYYQVNNFNVSFGIPSFFKTYVVSDVGFNKPGIDAIKNTISSISYQFKFNAVLFEPMFIYRTSETTNQFEGLGIVRIRELVWIGGGYRQDFGAMALAGFQLADKLKLGYAYEFSTNGVAGFNNGTHEIQLALRIGKRQVQRPAPKTPAAPEPVVPEPKPVEPKEESKPEEEPVVEVPKQEAPVLPVVEPKTDPKEETKPQEVTPEPEPEPEKPRKLNGEELPSGHYVVVGVFKFQTNAKTYRDQLGLASYPAEMAYVPAKGYYIVHLGMDTDMEKAKVLRDKYRRQSRYSLRDTWILSVD